MKYTYLLVTTKPVSDECVEPASKAQKKTAVDVGRPRRSAEKDYFGAEAGSLAAPLAATLLAGAGVEMPDTAAAAAAAAASTGAFAAGSAALAASASFAAFAAAINSRCFGLTQ